MQGILLLLIVGHLP